MWYLKFICVVLMSVQVTSNEETGLNETSRRMYLGSYFKITAAPYMAIILWASNDLRCGASIVHQQLLVSAAHCFIPGSFYVKVGTDMFNGGERYDIDRVFIHPRYLYVAATDVYYNDASVVRLSRRLRYSDRVRPIALAPVNWVFPPSAIMETMGFGQYERGNVSPYLLRAAVSYVDSIQCGNILRLRVTSSMMCVVGAACKGDSGGPLVYNNVLVGIVSFGRGCGGRLPAVYARVSFVRDFIDSVIRAHS